MREESDLVESDEYSQLVNNSVKELTGDIARWVASEEFASSPFEGLRFQDSVSNVGSKASGCSKLSSAASKASRSSSVSAAKAKAAARRAGLQAEADNLEFFQAIQREEFGLQQRKKALELRTEIAKAEAEELAYAEAEASCAGSPTPSQIVVRRQESGHHEELSPDTKRAVPKSSEDTDRKLHIKSPNVKPEEVNAAKPEDPALTGTFAHRLLEAQFQQNRRMEELIHKQQESTLALTLPEPEVPTFNGNPIEYWTFVRAFENLIERKTASESARLYYLVQYTIGEVQELVKSCLSMDPEEGYREARILLKQRYGQPYRIATAYVNKVTKGPPIKPEDSSALRRFSVLLTSCKNTLKEIGHLSKVENSDTLRMIIDRLPYGLKLKWRDEADRITEKIGREITIEDVSDFVTAKARAATHAIFGDISSRSLPPHRNSREKKPPRDASSFGIQSDTRKENSEGKNRPNQIRLKCPLCGSNHWLSHCQGFKGKSLSDRLTLVRAQGLCINCLVAGHMASSCPKASFCRVTGCKGVHSSYLHPKSVQPATNQSSENLPSASVESPEQGSVQDILNGYVKGNNESRNIEGHSHCQASVTGLAVIPVKVTAPGRANTVKTYAFLDNGSNTSFCSEKLAKQLGLSRKETSLSLTTMEKLGKQANRMPCGQLRSA